MNIPKVRTADYDLPGEQLHPDPPIRIWWCEKHFCSSPNDRLCWLAGLEPCEVVRKVLTDE